MELLSWGIFGQRFSNWNSHWGKKKIFMKETFHISTPKNSFATVCMKGSTKMKMSNFWFVFFRIFRLLSIGVINGSLPTREVYQYHRWDFDRIDDFFDKNCKISSNNIIIIQGGNTQQWGFKKIIYQEFELKKVPLKPPTKEFWAPIKKNEIHNHYY